MPTCRMIPAPAKLSGALVIQSSGATLIQCTLVGVSGQATEDRERDHGLEGEDEDPAGGGTQQRGWPAFEEHAHHEDRADHAPADGPAAQGDEEDRLPDLHGDERGPEVGPGDRTARVAQSCREALGPAGS